MSLSDGRPTRLGSTRRPSRNGLSGVNPMVMNGSRHATGPSMSAQQPGIRTASGRLGADAFIGGPRDPMRSSSGLTGVAFDPSGRSISRLPSGRRASGAGLAGVEFEPGSGPRMSAPRGSRRASAAGPRQSAPFGGFGDGDFVKVGNQPSRPQGFVEPRTSGRGGRPASGGFGGVWGGPVNEHGHHGPAPRGRGRGRGGPPRGGGSASSLGFWGPSLSPGGQDWLARHMGRR